MSKMVMIIFILHYLFFSFASSMNTSNFGNGRYKIYQIKPSKMEQLHVLNKLEQEGMLDFWRSPNGINSTADIMIDTHRDGEEFTDLLMKFSIDSKVLVDDLSKFIEERESLEMNKKIKSNGKIFRDDPESGRYNSFGMIMGEYYSYAEILAFMGRVVGSMPSKAQLRTIGVTNDGYPIQGIQFGNPIDKNRPVVWIDAGIHAREWTSIHTALYFIYYIANEINKNPKLTNIFNWIDVLIFPCLNPDGYQYTRSDPRNPAVRMWRKNRSREVCVKDKAGKERCCRGVDLNRNFDFKFAATGTSFFPCSEIFHGSGPFSEIETQAIRDAIVKSDLRNRLVGLITMHAYSQLWIYPYSHRKHSYPADIDDLRALAKRAVTAIGEKFGTPYLHGTGPETIYAYTGGSADWAKETVNIKYTYTIELRPSYWSWNGFVLSQSQLIPTARETLDGIMVVLEECATNTAKAKNRAFIVTVNNPSLHINTVCEDRSQYCSQWISSNARICIDSRAAMLMQCKKSCGLCTKTE